MYGIHIEFNEEFKEKNKKEYENIVLLIKREIILSGFSRNLGENVFYTEDNLKNKLSPVIKLTNNIYIKAYSFYIKNIKILRLEEISDVTKELRGF
jgi:virulence-associated protein VapD